MILRRFCRFLADRCWLVSISASVAGAVLAVLVFGLSDAARDAPPAFRGAMQSFQRVDPPKPAPTISFTDRAEKALSLADFRGRIVLLNYWATWCGPCVEEMPALERLQAKHGGNEFQVAAISVDRQGLPVVDPFLDKIGIRQLPIYLDRSGASMRAFAVRGLPTTILLDREGNEVGRLEGMAEWDSPAAEALIRHYIGDAAPPLKKAALVLD